MKIVILCGGMGTRLREETEYKPKPMIRIGDYPIVWHIMNIYAAYGFNEFIVALGYKGEVLKEYFANYYRLQGDLTISLKNGEIIVTKKCYREWTVHLINTGINSMTGGRLYRLKNKLKDETFMLTYGDGVSNVDINKLLEFHKSHKKIATVTAVKPSARFGGMKFNGDRIIEFTEKPQTGEGWINGGFFVFEPKVFDYLHGDDIVLEREPLENLVKDCQLMAYKHDGFWQCMDTLRDKQLLDNLWAGGNAPWKVWKD